MDSHYDVFDGDEEAALRYAMALSLEEVDAPLRRSTASSPIELDSDENEDDDLEKGPSYPPTPKKSAPAQLADGDIVKATLTKSGSQAAFPPIASDVNPSSFVVLGLDRKRMEEERLARAAKRKAPCEDETTGHRTQRVKLESRPPRMGAAVAVTTQSPPLPYLKGTVKKTVSSFIPKAAGSIAGSV
jgi:hypothetical protein